jgi:nicotinate-nucleotide adenylyltransferase
LRIALFGGTFDPIHNAHLKIAREAAMQCALDRIWFIPASRGDRI